MQDRKVASPRSAIVAEEFLRATNINFGATALDIGCGSGAMIRGFTSVRPDLKYWGHDLSDRELKHLVKISTFQKLYNCDVSEIDRKFELITMHHVLEHITDPLSF